MSIKRKQLGVSIEGGLLEKLDSITDQMRRTRSQAIETLIDEYSINKEALLGEQAQKIKELESELILLKSDTVVLPEVDKDLIEKNEALKERVKNQRSVIENIIASAEAIESPMEVVMEYLGKVISNVNDIKDLE